MAQLRRVSAPARVHRRGRRPQGLSARRGGLRRRAAFAQHAGGARRAAARRADLRARSPRASASRPSARPSSSRRGACCSPRASCASSRGSRPIRFDGTLRLGVIPTIGPYLLPEITPRARARVSPPAAALDRGAYRRPGARAQGRRARRRAARARGRRQRSRLRGHRPRPVRPGGVTDGTHSSRAEARHAPTRTSSRARRCCSSTMDIVSGNRR